MKLDQAAKILERRRNYLRSEIAQQGDCPNSWDAAEAAALDEVLAALYDTGDAPRAPGMEPVYFRDYRYGKDLRVAIQRADAANSREADGRPAPSVPDTTNHQEAPR